jgi:hypothetical protein
MASKLTLEFLLSGIDHQCSSPPFASLAGNLWKSAPCCKEFQVLPAALEACAHLWSPGDWKYAVTPQGFGLHSVRRTPELENIGSLRPS